MKTNLLPDTPKRETRLLAREMRIKRSDTGAPVLEGYASVFNTLSEDLGGFREQILPGAFTTSLANGADVRCLFNHEESLILGRTKAKTLELKEDATGLFFACSLPDTQVARDLAVSVERGDVDQCSFGFYCLDDDWAMMENTPVRSVKVAEVFDVSAVTYPAYTAASCSLRSLWKDGQPESIERGLRSLASAVGHNGEERSQAGPDDPHGDEMRRLRVRLLLAESSL